MGAFWLGDAEVDVYRRISCRKLCVNGPCLGFHRVFSNVTSISRHVVSRFVMSQYRLGVRMIDWMFMVIYSVSAIVLG
jgi:hypothetical protein